MITCITASAEHLRQSDDILIEAPLFCDGAYNIQLPEQLRSCSVRLIHNNRSHDDWMLLYLLIGQFEQRDCTLDLILPYISYGRQTPDYLITLLKPLQCQTVKSITTIDLHQDRYGIINKPAAPLIAQDILTRQLNDHILVAPDKGSIERIQSLAALTKQQVISLQKQRTPNQVRITSATPIPKNVGALIIDDMVDTGSTLKACIDHLYENGVPSVHVYATHGVLSYGIGEWADKLASLTFLNTLPSLSDTQNARWLTMRSLLS